MTIDNLNFYGLRLSIIDEKIFLNSVNNTVIKNKKTICYGHSFGSINLMRKYPQIYELGNQAEIMLVDGRPFYYLCKILKIPLMQSISIPQAVHYTLNLADNNGYSLFLLGADEVTNSQACKLVKSNYQGIKSVHGIHGYFEDQDQNRIIDLINKFSADILLIGMNSPKKERFVLRNKNELNAKLIIPCGGMIDVLAGKTKVTPIFIKKLGLASFYRLYQEPRRLIKRHLSGYFYILLFFLPIVLYNIVIKKNKRFSIPVFLKID